ncbi:hypothetical protein [Roseibium sp.]|uniref:hypothetical protein n=1 Tax=Roseibium sp. TaxID=1936156 RepID=UPI003A97BAB9
MTQADPVSESEIRDALERVLESEEFQSSPRIKDVLRYIVEKMLEGRSDEIHEPIIAYEVFNRTSDDPDSSSSVVRVTMARLRRKLSHYYQSAGVDDPIRIEISAGSYAPVFHRVGREEVDIQEIAPTVDAAEQVVAGRKLLSRAHKLLIVLGVILIAVSSFLVAEFVLHERYREHYEGDTSEMPFVAVVGLDHKQETGELGRRFQMALTSDLANLSALRVMAPGPGGSEQLLHMTLAEMRASFGLSHFISGVYVVNQDELQFDVQLQATKTSQILWAERYAGHLDNFDGFLAHTVSDIATALSVVVDPDETKRISLNHTSNRSAITLFSNAMRSLYPPDQPGRTFAAIEMFKEVTVLDPTFAGGFAGLALAHAQLVLYQHSSDPDSDLKKAIGYADEAIKVDPDYGFGHSAKGYAYSVMGDHHRSVVESYRAVTLAPSDPISQMRFAVVLCLAGRHEDALVAIDETLHLDPLKTRTPYRNLRGVILYNLGRYKDALAAFDENVSLRGPRAGWIKLIHAMTYARLGMNERAIGLLQEAKGALGRVPAEYWLDVWFSVPGAADEAKADLVKLGWDDLPGVN